MITIYGDSNSGNCLKVKWVCDTLALPYRWTEVDTRKGETRTPQFLAMNGAGQVPTIAFDDGRTPQTLSSSLVGFGDAEGSAGGASAMSKSVGLTAAVGVQRVLAHGLPRLAGVVRPTERSVWEFCLPTLEEEGMRFQESVEYDRAADVEAPAQAAAAHA